MDLNSHTSIEHAGNCAFREEHPEAATILFLLPGLGGSQKLLVGEPGVVPVHYLDWTEIVKQGSGFAALYRDVKEQIDSQLPNGPFAIAGYSVGGPLAYACARALEGEGRPATWIGILDERVDVWKAAPLRKRLQARWKELCSFNVRAGLASVAAKLLTRPADARMLRRLASYRGARLPFGFESYLHNKIRMQLLQRVFNSWWHPILRSPELLSTPVTVFRSEEHGPCESDDLGWGRHCGNVQILPVAGSHRTMLDIDIQGPLSSALLQLSGNLRPVLDCQKLAETTAGIEAGCGKRRPRKIASRFPIQH